MTNLQQFKDFAKKNVSKGRGRKGSGTISSKEAIDLWLESYEREQVGEAFKADCATRYLCINYREIGESEVYSVSVSAITKWYARVLAKFEAENAAE